MMRKAWQFLTNMDIRAVRAVVVTILLFGGVGVILAVAALGFHGKGITLAEHWLGLAAHSVFALPIAVAAFAALAFVGAPQFVLIGACVAVFGPVAGAFYSWAGTWVSALVGFGLGRRFGAKALADLPGQGTAKFMTFLKQNGFLASLIVRLVPSAPFIIVNMAAGAAGVGMRPYALGTAIGIIPKIALVALAGAGFGHAARGGGLQAAGLAGLGALIWLAAMLWARRKMQRAETR